MPPRLKFIKDHIAYDSVPWVIRRELPQDLFEQLTLSSYEKFVMELKLLGRLGLNIVNHIPQPFDNKIYLYVDQVKPVASSDGRLYSTLMLEKDAERRADLVSAVEQTFISLLNYWTGKLSTNDLYLPRDIHFVKQYMWGVTYYDAVPKVWLVDVEPRIEQVLTSFTPTAGYYIRSTCIEWLRLMQQCTPQLDKNLILNHTRTALELLLKHEPDSIRDVAKIESMLVYI